MLHIEFLKKVEGPCHYSLFLCRNHHKEAHLPTYNYRTHVKHIRFSLSAIHSEREQNSAKLESKINCISTKKICSKENAISTTNNNKFIILKDLQFSNSNDFHKCSMMINFHKGTWKEFCISASRANKTSKFKT